MRGSLMYVVAALACGMPIAALAIEAPQLPSSAKKALVHYRDTDIRHLGRTESAIA